MDIGCKGRDHTPQLDIKTCPQCGAPVEVFSVDDAVVCDACGFTVYNDVQSCVQWCEHARLCVGDELYFKMKAAASAADAAPAAV